MDLESKLSPIVRDMAPSGIRRFFDLVNQIPDAISLGVGEPDFVTPYHIRKTVTDSLEHGPTSYTSNQGLPELLSAVSEYLRKRFDLSYHPETEIITTFGGSEAIDLALRALICPGDEVMVVEPSYVSYEPCVVLAGGIPVPVATHAKEGFKLRVEDLERCVTPKTKALIISFPNNPTGAIMTAEDYTPIVEFVKKHELIVISDEIYAELTYKNKNHVSIASFDGMKDHTILINGFSKSFAMTGWRIGFIAAPEILWRGMLKIHQYTALCAPRMSQIAALEALQNGLQECLNMKQQYDRRRRFVVHSLSEMGLTCMEPEGAFYVFPSITSTGLDAESFAEQLLLEEGVAVVPGGVFGPSGTEHIRCSYATSLERLDEAMKRMKRFVEKKRQTNKEHYLQLG
ncbi:aminotransferase class I/II-fold pyridoxal phosphate-dependent enzyme [Shimazuella sp. AN120528]|uniref:aminotransferase class I/II-fold pyridoxal phosphate-dependent enzyme n=1 Tax=Shimazuella soli TaxID=1892854 RepID=UPI001F0EF3F6|nr:aminotransferase class I/II-fold pyridoxal phosphate-dependent enzyme [Shimazuella soli]MCH5586502.1 aminotransferase class I/II-fold pyridoxal phosphate-dependent enzyme [Shimazuella soli]